MPICRCLYCYKPLSGTETDFHPKCSKSIFNTTTPPELPFTETQLRELAMQVISSHEGITGVQPKLSLGVTGDKARKSKRFTIVGVMGAYILKPHTELFPTMPEVEDLTMHLATLYGITTVPHSLVRMRSGNLAYITRRIDRYKGKKLHMEDTCQLSERLTEHKYQGSYEQIARVIYKYSDLPGLDVLHFYQQVLFCFLTGNADMHLKNFSLINVPGKGTVLSPAYDMVSTALLLPEDDEDLALTLNGKKKKLKKSDFDAAFSHARLEKKQIEYLYAGAERFAGKANETIAASFLNEADKSRYRQIIRDRSQRLGL